MKKWPDFYEQNSTYITVGIKSDARI